MEFRVLRGGGELKVSHHYITPLVRCECKNLSIGLLSTKGRMEGISRGTSTHKNNDFVYVSFFRKGVN